MSFLVIQNSKGQTARVIPFNKETLEVIYRFDTKRIEILRSTEGLEDVEFKTLGSVEKNIKSGAVVAKGPWGQVRHADSIESAMADAAEHTEKDVRDFKFFLKWTSGIQLTLLALMIGIGLYISSHKEEKQTQIVKVFQRPPAEKNPVVEMNKIKLKEAVKFAAKKVQKSAPKIANVSARKQKGQNIRSGNQLREMGALSALGGMTPNSKGLGGLSKAPSNNMGYGFDATRASGGSSRSLLGKGLLQAGIGNGEKMNGYGGYGTHGKGNGQAGYGAVNLAGRSGGYFLPLSEEAMIEGGLDPDQVDAVIQRNKGQLRYCYEKALQSKPNVSGRVAIDFVISAAGHVSTAKVAHTSTKSAIIDSCILDTLKNLKFPKPKGNVSVKVNYPFRFTRG